MKTLLLAIFTSILLTALPAAADSERYVTVTLPTLTAFTNYTLPILPGITFTGWGATNTVTIAEGETGELVYADGGSNTSGSAAFKVTKNDVTRSAVAVTGATPRGTTVAGPATFSIHYATESNSNGNITPEWLKLNALMTVKISPMTIDPRQTVTVAPGMGNVQIVLESSTNLLTWADATNGVYSDDLRFFRVKLTKLNP